MNPSDPQSPTEEREGYSSQLLGCNREDLDVDHPSPSRASLPPPPSVFDPPVGRPLSQAREADLKKLWCMHAAEYSSNDGTPNSLLSGGLSAELALDSHVYGFVLRLHDFLLHATAKASSAPGPAHEKGEDEDSTGFTPENRTFESLRFLFRTKKRHKRRTRAPQDEESPSKQQKGADPKSETGEVEWPCPVAPATSNRDDGSRDTISSLCQVVTFDHGAFTAEFALYEVGGGKDGRYRQIPSEYLRSSSFGAFLHHRPDQALAVLGTAIGLTLQTICAKILVADRRKKQTSSLLGPPSGNAVANGLFGVWYAVRFVNAEPQTRMAEIRTSSAHKFLSVRGHVTRAKPKRLRVVSAQFICLKCGGQFRHRFPVGRLHIPPSKCRAADSTGTPAQCRSQSFELHRKTATYVDVQEIRLQEVQDEARVDAGRTPRTLEVEAVGPDLVDTCRPGDVVRVAGVVRAINTAIASGATAGGGSSRRGSGGKAAVETSTYQLYLTANSIARTDGDIDNDTTPGQGNSMKSSRRNQHHVSFDTEQLQRITKVAHADHKFGPMSARRAFPFDLLVRSVCPSIIGHDLVKAGLLLALLGGTPDSTSPHSGAAGVGVNAISGLSSSSAGSGMSIRSNIHVLVVGDPGMGKSQMLLAASQVAARSVYVGGNTSSTTGLTVTLTKEAGGETGIEAGALVLADQGVCCIDEFDKMAKANQDGLLEAMEQQHISIAKAGVVASMPARCSVVAAANPKHGTYDMGKTVAENLNMASPLLSRFDLVFILRDRADIDRDRMVSSNIMALYSDQQQKNSVDRKRSHEHFQDTGQEFLTPEAFEERYGDPDCGRVPLSHRLQWVAETQRSPLPAELVRDYVAYAREYCRPKMTPEAAEVLKNYFMELRYPKDVRRNDTVPITTRQLEALIRLSQARAKACLREFVLAEDAEDVVDLMKQSVDQVHADENGIVDRTRGGAGGKSKRGVKRKFIDALENLAGPTMQAEFTLDDLRRVADGVKCELSTFRSMLDDLRNEGLLMKNAKGAFKLCS